MESNYRLLPCKRLLQMSSNEAGMRALRKVQKQVEIFIQPSSRFQKYFPLVSCFVSFACWLFFDIYIYIRVYSSLMNFFKILSFDQEFQVFNINSNDRILNEDILDF